MFTWIGKNGSLWQLQMKLIVAWWHCVSHFPSWQQLISKINLICAKVSKKFEKISLSVSVHISAMVLNRKLQFCLLLSVELLKCMCVLFCTCGNVFSSSWKTFPAGINSALWQTKLLLADKLHYNLCNHHHRRTWSSQDWPKYHQKRKC